MYVVTACMVPTFERTLHWTEEKFSAMSVFIIMLKLRCVRSFVAAKRLGNASLATLKPSSLYLDSVCLLLCTITKITHSRFFFLLVHSSRQLGLAVYGCLSSNFSSVIYRSKHKRFDWSQCCYSGLLLYCLKTDCFSDDVSMPSGGHVFV